MGSVAQKESLESAFMIVLPVQEEHSAYLSISYYEELLSQPTLQANRVTPAPAPHFRLHGEDGGGFTFDSPGLIYAAALLTA
jgi:hypothetical protein